MKKTLNDSINDFTDFMKKYTDFDDFTRPAKLMNKSDIEEASNALQDLLVKQLEQEIEDYNLITWEHDSDGDRPNYDNLIEWLSLYYELREK